jgi:methylmalonyl-CoA mutase
LVKLKIINLVFMFEEFEKYLTEVWKEAAIAEINGKNLDEVISWKTDEGFDVEAFYQENDLKKLDYLKKFHASLFNPEQPQKTPRNSQIIRVLSAKEANQIALDALSNGANEVCFEISGKSEPDLGVLLKDILLPYCAVSFGCPANQITGIARSYVEYAQDCKYDLTTLTGNIHATDQENSSIQDIKTRLEVTEKAANFAVIDIIGREKIVTDRIATILAYAVKTINALLKEGISIADIAKKIQLSVSLHNNYFVEIAGLRALRLLFAEIIKAYGLKDYAPHQVRIHALSSVIVDEKTSAEPDWNMLSNSMQAMAAVIGGCDILSVLPHTHGIAEEDNFSARIARNVYNLLIEESYIDRATDLAAGSYYIDTLTDKIAETSWEKFKQIVYVIS